MSKLSFSPKQLKIKGFTLVELSVVCVISAIIATIGLYAASQQLSYSKADAQADSLNTINEALLAYETKYFTNFGQGQSVTGPSGYTVGYPANLTPAIADLVGLGLLPQGTSSTNLYGGTYKTQITLAPAAFCPGVSCAMAQGITYLSSPILNTSGALDQSALGEAMQHSGGLGGFSTLSNPGVISGPGVVSTLGATSNTWSTTSPLPTTAGILAMQATYSSTGSGAFLMINGGNSMTGTLNMGAQNISNANTITATGNITSGGILAAASANITGAISAASETITGLFTAGSASITGNASVGGTLTAGSTTVNGNLQNNGNFATTGTAGVTGLLTAGSATINGATTINGLTTVTGNIQNNGNFATTGTAGVGGLLTAGGATINGLTTVNGTLQNNGNFATTGAASVNGLLTAGSATINGLTTINGNIQNNGNFDTTGTASVGGKLTAGTLAVGTTAITGNLSVSGTTTLAATTATSLALPVGNALTIGGASTAYYGDGTNLALRAPGAVYFQNTAGTSAIGIAEVGNIASTGVITAPTLTVSGVTTTSSLIANNASVSGTLTVTQLNASNASITGTTTANVVTANSIALPGGNALTIGGANTAYYGDGTNLALRASSAGGAVYFQTTNGAAPISIAEVNNITSSGTITSTGFRPSGVVTSGAGCTPNGAFEMSATGAPLFCVSGVWSSPSGLGVGQSWTNVTGSRSNGGTYCNSTGLPIFVNISFDSSSGGQIYGYFYVNNVLISEYNYRNNGYNNATNMSGIVPNGQCYKAELYGSNNVITDWSELR